MPAPAIAAGLKAAGSMILKNMAKGAAMKAGADVVGGLYGGSGRQSTAQMQLAQHHYLQSKEEKDLEEQAKLDESMDYIRDMIADTAGHDLLQDEGTGDDIQSDARKKQVIQDLQDKRKKGGVINKADMQRLQDEVDRVQAASSNSSDAAKARLSQDSDDSDDARAEMRRMTGKANAWGTAGNVLGFIANTISGAGATGRRQARHDALVASGKGIGGLISGFAVGKKRDLAQKALDYFSSVREKKAEALIEELEGKQGLTDWQKAQLQEKERRQAAVDIRAERIRLGLEKGPGEVDSDSRLKNIDDATFVIRTLRTGVHLSDEDYKDFEKIDPKEVARAILKEGRPYKGYELQFLDDLLSEDEKYKFDVKDAANWKDDVLNGYMKHIRNFHYTYKPEATEIDPQIDPDEEHIGPMAQDIEQVNPACIKETADGTKTVDTGRLALMNAGAIAELAREVAELKNE